MSAGHRFVVPRSLCSGSTTVKQSLGFWRLLGILYLVTCCGAYATEALVEAGKGPFFCLLGLVVLPWLWGVPTALGVAELATSMPSNGGALVWVNCTYHASVTFTIAVCTLFMNIVDNAIYPHLCADYLLQVIGDQPPWVSLLAKVATVVVTCTLNILGVGAVGDVSAVSMVLCSLPFVLLFGIGIPQLEPRHWLDHGGLGEVHWGKILSMLTWNLSGFDAAGHVVEEIQDPKTDFPRAVMACLAVTSLTYMLPILIGTSVDQNYADWEDGYWGAIASKVGGLWLQVVVGLGGCFSGFGLLLSYTCATSRATASMATMGIFPDAINRYLGVLSADGTPTRAILLMSTLTAVCTATLDFSDLVAVSSFFYAFRLLLALLALPLLRFLYPSLPRPYQLPCGLCGVVAAVAFPVCFCAATLVACAFLSTTTLVLGPAFMAVVLLLSLVYVRVCKPLGFQGVIIETDPSSDDSSDEEVEGRGEEVEDGPMASFALTALSGFDGVLDPADDGGGAVNETKAVT
eukprot:GGOE01037235.1.p1 GENE.GGOE01037235.1~~GGOE01037235.1.p1  ORF type:complete len:538 (-),score=151.22 GGOE01037235.1:33-1586(-)